MATKPASTKPAAPEVPEALEQEPSAEPTSEPSVNGDQPATAPVLTVNERIVLGGRGAKTEKAADGTVTITAPAEATKEVYKGLIDLSALADPANALAVRNLAALFVIEQVHEAARQTQRTNGADYVATPEVIASYVAAAIANVSDPFVPKVKATRVASTVKTKEKVATLTNDRDAAAALAVRVGQAYASGDTAEGQRLQAELMALVASFK